MSHELIAILMFSSMMLLLMTGQRVFGAIGAWLRRLRRFRCGAPVAPIFRLLPP